MIDGRMERDRPVNDYRDPERFDPNRSKLGEAQTARLTEWLRDSDAQWKLVGNNVMFSEVDLGRMARDIRFNMDAWDGYPANRSQIFDTLDAHTVCNVVVLTGDIHTAWGIELTRAPRDKKVYRRTDDCTIYGAEFVSQSVSSFNVDEFFGRFLGKLAGRYMGARRRNPHVHYRNVVDHGYLLIELTRDAAVATWHYTRDPYERTLSERPSRQMTLPHNGRLGKAERLRTSGQ
jgi:alkaline phosphatase D